MVSDERVRRSSKAFKSHLFPEALPNRCLFNLGEGLLVASPELCFFQLASELSFAKLVQLGYELCGTYSLPMRDDYAKQGVESIEDAAYNHSPLTTKKRLSAFVAQMSGRHGYKRASRALTYVIEASGSPMETNLAILLTLPSSQGGYGLPLPEMNKRVETKKSVKKNMNKNYYKCDLSWSNANVVAEYDSTQYHNSSDKIGEDSIRRTDLALNGVEVISVTNRQINSTVEFEKIARQIAARMQKRLQQRSRKFISKRSELRRQLLGT